MMRKAGGAQSSLRLHTRRCTQWLSKRRRRPRQQLQKPRQRSGAPLRRLEVPPLRRSDRHSKFLAGSGQLRSERRHQLLASSQQQRRERRVIVNRHRRLL